MDARAEGSLRSLWRGDRSAIALTNLIPTRSRQADCPSPQNTQVQFDGVPSYMKTPRPLRYQSVLLRRSRATRQGINGQQSQLTVKSDSKLLHVRLCHLFLFIHSFTSMQPGKEKGEKAALTTLRNSEKERRVGRSAKAAVTVLRSFSMTRSIEYQLNTLILERKRSFSLRCWLLSTFPPTACKTSVTLFWTDTCSRRHACRTGAACIRGHNFQANSSIVNIIPVKPSSAFLLSILPSLHFSDFFFSS